MKIGLVYQTKREKAMVQIVSWLEQALLEAPFSLVVGKPEVVKNQTFDAYILGSSVYAGAIQKELLDYINKMSDSITGKPVATFIVCKEIKQPEDHMKQILDVLPEEPFAQSFFEGYMFRKGKFDKQETRASEFAKVIITKLATL